MELTFGGPSKMNILLTGGTGYIGSHTAVVLAEQKHNVILYDNLSNSDENVVDKVQLITGKPITFIRGDIRDRDAVLSCLKTFEIDAVIHFAGLKAVGESTESPLKYFENNVSGSINLFSCMHKTGIKNLIFSSSAAVYGEPESSEIFETNTLCPLSPYGTTKLQIENILSDLSTSDPTWQIICLRYFNPVGAHTSGIIGESSPALPNNLMPFILNVASKNIDELVVHGNTYNTKDGTGIRDYIHIMDLSNGHVKALGHLKNNPQFDVFNLGTGRGYSVLELISHFELHNKVSIPFRVGPPRAGDVASCIASPAKAIKILNWKPVRTLRDMCVDSWQYKYRQLSILKKNSSS